MNKLYITIAGKSNVGKSSFINHLCNNYVTPESSKLQTTRINTYHSFINKNSEIIFIDTPGISVVKKDLMSDFMKKSYIKSLDIADAVLIIFDISKKETKNESSIIKICEENNIPVFISVNKIDLYKDDSILFADIYTGILFSSQILIIDDSFLLLFLEISNISRTASAISSDLIYDFFIKSDIKSFLTTDIPGVSIRIISEFFFMKEW